MTTLLIVFIYLIGVILAYLSYRKYWTMDGENWTVGHRRKGVIFAIIANWFMLIVYTMATISISENDKPASW